MERGGNETILSLRRVFGTVVWAPKHSLENKIIVGAAFNVIIIKWSAQLK